MKFPSHSAPRISSEKPPSCQPHPILMKSPNQALDFNIIKQHKFAQKLQHLQLIINQSFHIPAHHLIFHQVVSFLFFFYEIPSYQNFSFFPEHSFSELEKAKNVSARTSSQTSIDAESSDEQTNTPPQISPQAVSSQCQHNDNNHPIPPPPKVNIPNPLLKEASLRNLMKSPYQSQSWQALKMAFKIRIPYSAFRNKKTHLKSDLQTTASDPFSLLL
ncbi:hypothetical protein O181_115825 [Austropuccinia psidii MF-1]|uniref:Uncharacterized protein n=1 Tax=Austropuccinia psidii MF-1 TaxID=1389203 RepID=A0A9Q3PWU5_9BASI|nr:hypothetical protein [Austropuccinia psidii MF-1]